MSLRFKSALQSYLLELEERGLSQKTLAHNRNALSQFIEFCRNRGLREVQAITGEHVVAFRRQIAWNPGVKGELLSQNSIYLVLRLVRSFLKWLHEQDHLLRDLTGDWILPRPLKSPTRTPTVEEMSKLLLTPNVKVRAGLRNRAILELLYGTGVRLGECLALKLEHLDLPASQLQVVDGKGGTSRNLPLGSRLKQILKRYLKARAKVAPENEQALFLTRTGKPITAGSIAQILRRNAQIAGLKPFSSHAIRRGFATHLLENGADIKVIQALLGHKHLDSTQFYLQPDFQELKKVYSRTHPRASKRG